MALTGMRRLAGALVLLGAAEVAAQDATREAAVLAVARARHAADFRADRAALDTLLADDLTYGRTSGVVHTKAQVLSMVGATGPYALDYSRPDSLVVRVYGDAAIVTGVLTVKLTAQPAPYTLRYTDTWVWRRGRWQLVAFQATRLP